MPKSERQKLKLLCLMNLFLEETDEDHTLTIPKIIEKLGTQGIHAERKSLYDDFETLRQFGLDIECLRSRTTGYYLASRLFELPELKLLTDAVASSQFITEKKSAQLIRKLESLASRHQAWQLHRQVYVQGRIKAENEQIYYNVDAIQQAIAKGRQISFLYFCYTVDKEKTYRHDGNRYAASPYALTWNGECYYMIAFYEEYGELSQFRVDKMENIEVLDEKCLPIPGNRFFDPASYQNKLFNMFGGKEEDIRIAFDESMAGVVLDRFGREIVLHRLEEGRFFIDIRAFASPQLLGWLFAFGGRAQILKPENLIGQFLQLAEECFSQYGGQGLGKQHLYPQNPDAMASGQDI